MKENFKNRRCYLRYSTKREEGRRSEKRDLLFIDGTNMQIVVVVVAIKKITIVCTINISIIDRYYMASANMLTYDIDRAYFRKCMKKLTLL